MTVLKPLAEQVIVITGASSGIGRVTAKLAAERGARVVVSARNADELEKLVTEIRAAGGRAALQVADVAYAEEVELIGERAISEFGYIDTWVNNAGVSLYGRIMDVELDDMKRLFDVNYWGVVHGSRTAIPYLARQGGALINVASALADRAIPLQGTYCAAKHAVKGFTDALRMELDEQGTPISVTLVKPSSMNTPLFEKARTVFEVEPTPVPPVYDPRVTAEAILEAACRPLRDVTPGAMGKVMQVAGEVSPRLTDRFMEKKTFDAQHSGIPLGTERVDNLYEPVESDGGDIGHLYRGHVRRSSVYTWTALHPRQAAGAVLLAGIGVAALSALRSLSRRRDGTRLRWPR